MPSLTAIILTAIMSGKKGVGALLRKIVQGRVHIRWYAAALLLVPLLLSIALGLYLLLGGAPLVVLWVTLPFSFLLYLIVAGLGEELGWRGFALPRLQEKRPAFSASLMLGVIWGLWHLPILVVASQPLTPLFVVGGTIFVVIMVGFSVLSAWIYNNTRGSLLLVILFHAAITMSLNTFLIAYRSPLPGVLMLVVLWLTIAIIVRTSAIAARRQPSLA